MVNKFLTIPYRSCSSVEVAAIEEETARPVCAAANERV